MYIFANLVMYVYTVHILIHSYGISCVCASNDHDAHFVLHVQMGAAMESYTVQSL